MIDFQALHLATPAHTFTVLQRAHIVNMAHELTQKLGTPVEAYFGDTETGEQWVSLSVDELPQGSGEQSGPLLFIEAGTGPEGSHRVINRHPRKPAIEGGTLDYEKLHQKVLKAAQSAYKKMCSGSAARLVA